MRMKSTIYFSLILLLGAVLLLSPARSAADVGQAPRHDGPVDRRFGAVETYDAPQAAYQAGVGWTRIPFLWSRMQPNGGHEWIPPISDEALAAEIAQGRQPVGLIITTPAWATDQGIGPGVPGGLHLGHNDPGNLWGNFVRQLVSTYAGRIDHWIIWNEPDVWDENHPGYTWGGSLDDFIQLQRVAYLVIKETNPNATVIFAGTSYWWDAAYGRNLYFRRYLDQLMLDPGAVEYGFFCDAVALHVYFQPDFVYSITAVYHQIMREHGFDKPIWIVETNAAPSLDPQMPAPNARFAITLEEQAAYIVQAFAMGIAGGASRISVFKMIDTPGDLSANPEPFGLVRGDGSRRPAFQTYQVATTYLAGFQSGSLEQRADVSIVTVQRSGGTTTVAWTRTPAPVTVQVLAQADSAVLVDMWGNRRTIQPSDGVYTVDLAGATCTHTDPCIIGGPPKLIVEGSLEADPPPPAQPPPSNPPPQPTVTPDETSPAQPEPAEGETDATAPPATATPIPPTTTAAPVTPTPTPRPEYRVNLTPLEMLSARRVWDRKKPASYLIKLAVGAPPYLLLLNVDDGKITQARQSVQPVESLDDPPPLTDLYNLNRLLPFTVEGLFGWVDDYYQSDPPACATDVEVKLNGNYGFPQQIVESWPADCPAEPAPARVEVLQFATATATASPTATPVRSTATPPSSPTSASPTHPPTAPGQPVNTPSVAHSETGGGFNPLVLGGLVLLGAGGFYLFWRNRKA